MMSLHLCVALLCVAIAFTKGVNWNGQDWAMNCDFRGNDLSNAPMLGSGAGCSGRCAATHECTHYVWTGYQSGTCWLKRGRVSKSDAFDVAPVTACGVLDGGHQPAPTDGQHRIQVVNRCARDLWIGVLGNPGFPIPDNGGFELRRGASRDVLFKADWVGRLWGRTNCRQDGARFHCETGDCGGRQCSGRGGEQPATLAEINFQAHGGLDYYDVSLVDGYNLPVTFEPVEHYPRGRCEKAGCVSDLLTSCPAQLQKRNGAGQVIACYSACSKFNSDVYCCRGAHNRPQTCRATADWPTNYCAASWAACPQAYCYAYDDKRGTFTCAKPGHTTHYKVTFC